MNPNHMVNFFRVFMLSFLLVGIGCRAAKGPKPVDPQKPPVIAPVKVRIGNFLCEDQVTAQAVHNVFIEVFSKNRRLRIVRDVDAEVIVEGTITRALGGSSGSKLGAGPDWAVGKSQAVVGEYVSGISTIAYRNGEVLTSASWGQVMDKGGKLLPPEYVAREAALTLLRKLESKFLRAKFDDIVWCGLDYSKARMIGTKADFPHSGQGFPDVLLSWNELFVNSMLSELGKAAKSVETDLKAVQSSNQKVLGLPVEPADGSPEEFVALSHITDSDIGELVRSYALDHKKGTGMVFVVDRLVSAQATSCFYVVLFDVESRNVIYSGRYCERAGGSNFRDYWFRPFRVTVEKLRR